VPSLYLRGLFALKIARAADSAETCEQGLREAVAHFRKLAVKAKPGRIEYPHALRDLARLRKDRPDPRRAEEVGALLDEARAYTATRPRVAGYRRAFAHTDAGHWRLLREDETVPAEWFAVAADHWRTHDQPDTRQFLAEAVALQSHALRTQGRAKEADDAEIEAEAVMARVTDKNSVQLHRARELLAGRVPAWD